MGSATLKEGGYTFGAWVLLLGLFVTPTVLIYMLEQCLLNTMRQPETRGICPLEGQRKLSFIKTKVAVFHGHPWEKQENRSEKHEVPPVPKAEKEPNKKKPTGSVPPT